MGKQYEGGGTPTWVFTLYKFRQVFATRDMCARITRRRRSEDVRRDEQL